MDIAGPVIATLGLLVSAARLALSERQRRQAQRPAARDLGLILDRDEVRRELWQLRSREVPGGA